MAQPTIDVIADSFENAFDQAIAQLNVTEDQLEYEILDEGSKGFLGIGGRQMRVRFFVKEMSEQKAYPKPAHPIAVPSTPEEAKEGESIVFHAMQYTEDLLTRMGYKAKVNAHVGPKDENGEQTVYVSIEGSGLNALVGKKAETLNAFQYILTLLVNKKVEKWVQVVVDVDGFRERRAKQLKQLANRMAEQAVKTGRRQLLEPMSSSERRVIHIELKDHAEVYTESVGEGPGRKVSIALKKN